jgi:hypothetical protein
MPSSWRIVIGRAAACGPGVNRADEHSVGSAVSSLALFIVTRVMRRRPATLAPGRAPAGGCRASLYSAIWFINWFQKFANSKPV